MIVLSEVHSAASKALRARFSTIFVCELVVLIMVAPLIGLWLALGAAISTRKSPGTIQSR